MLPKRKPNTPGEILLEEFLKPLKMSQRELARCLGVQTKLVNEIIKGKRAISARSAILLSEKFNTTPEFWMNLQNMVDLHEALAALRKNGRRHFVKQSA